jgi:sterol desaturase/sphingolipid hydroxylase (fatty acid hydroxylase superfamily)
MHDHHLFGPDAMTTLKNAGLLWLHMFPHEYVRYLVAATLAFLGLHVALSRALSGRKIRPARAPSKQMVREFLTSTRTAGVFAFSGLMTIGGIELGLIHIYSLAGERGWLYFAFTVVALIVLHDAWFYWTHRLIHDPRLFRRFHRTHHRSMNPTPWTAYSFDIGEAAINALYTPLALMLFPTSDLAMVIFLTHMIVRNVVGHSGYELFPATRGGRPLLPFLTTVTHHDLHHAQAGWNYGLYFTWWDKLMGTEHPLYAEKFAAAVRKPLDGSAVGALSSGAEAKA